MVVELEKPVDDKIKLLDTPEYLKYDPANASICWVDINLSAPVYEEDENARAAVDIVAVIDMSGSMGGGKLDLVEMTLRCWQTDAQGQALTYCL